MTLTYPDSNILILAANAESPGSNLALELLSDPSRTFVASPALQLEVLPKARFHGRHMELVHFQTFFARVVAWAVMSDVLFETALRIASEDGINAIDALHIAAALQVGAEEFVTAESPRKSRLARSNRLPVRLI